MSSSPSASGPTVRERIKSGTVTAVTGFGAILTLIGLVLMAWLAYDKYQAYRDEYDGFTPGTFVAEVSGPILVEMIKMGFLLFVVLVILAAITSLFKKGDGH